MNILKPTKSIQQTKKELFNWILMVGAVFLTLNYTVDNYLINILIPFLKALYLIAALVIIGFFILPRKSTLMEYMTTGMVFSSFYFFVISSLKILNTLSLIIYLLIPLILSAITIKHPKREYLLNSIKEFTHRRPIEFLIFLFPLIYASLPSTYYDTLVYHLGIPNLYLQNSGFIAAPQLMYSNMSIYYELSLIPAVFTGLQVPRIFHFLIGTVFFLSIVDFSTTTLKVTRRTILLLIIASLPISLFLLTTVKSDLISALFIFAAVKTYDDKRYPLSALFWGFSIGIKNFSGIALIIFLVLMMVKNRNIALKRHLIVGGIILLVLLPLMIKNLIICGNPFFPFFSHIFTSEFWDPVKYSMVRHEVGTQYHSIADFFTLPIRISFKVIGAGGVVGPIFLIFLPFLVQMKKLAGKYLLFFALLLLVLGPFFGEAIRYIYVVFPLLSIFATISYERMNRKILKIIFTIIVFINFTLGLVILESINAARLVYFDRYTTDEYIARSFPTYKAFLTVNHMDEPGIKVLIGGEARGFYLRKPYMTSSAHDYCIFKKYLNNSETVMEFVGNIKADGYTIIIFNLAEFKRLQGYKRLSKEEEKKLFAYLKSIIPSHQEGPLYIYNLNTCKYRMKSKNWTE
jgi:hypothetical protein